MQCLGLQYTFFSPPCHALITWFELSRVKLNSNKNALTAAFSLAYLEIKSRNEEEIDSKRNMIYSLKGIYLLLYRRRYFIFVSELI